MDHTFHELNWDNPFGRGPVRYPLFEVRWWPFLRGDAYVNPFHDLLYALSRTPLTTQRPGKLPKGSVRFTADSLIVQAGREEATVYRYDQLLAFKLDYQVLLNGPQRDYASNSVSYFTCYVRTEEMDHRTQLVVSQSGYLRFLEDLYRLRVPFREFTNGIRSFKTSTNVPYRRIQELKKKYGIQW
ncbi:MAG: hypothetical protein WA952_06745 [Lewinella sp.]